MSTVSLNELPEWLKSSAGDEVKALKKRTDYLSDKAMNAVSRIIEVGREIGDPRNPHHSRVDDREAEVATKFGQRVVSLGERIRRPDPETYENLRVFLENLSEFYRDLIRTGAVWIRKMDRSYKDPIRRMQLQLNELRSYARILDEHLQGKYGEVRKFESIIKDAESGKSTSIEIGSIKDELSTLKERSENLERELSDLESSKNELDVSKMGQEARELEEQVEIARRDIMKILDPLEKPFDKFLRLPEKEKIGAAPGTLDIMSQYLKDPIGSLLEEQPRFPRLKSTLQALGSALEARKLDLKETRIRAALKSVSVIRDEDSLASLRDNYLKVGMRRDEALQSDEMNELRKKRKETENKIELTRMELSKTERSIRELNTRHEELSGRLTDLTDKMERAIRELTGQTIQISNES
ncbi:MAG: hypothetical protein V1857_02710 [archaeon]